MKLFGKNQSSNVETSNEEKLSFQFVSRLEPAVYTRLGSDGVDVKAEELINTIEKLEINGSIYLYEMNPLIADYLVRTKAVKIKKYSGGLDRCVITKRQELMNLMVQSKDILEKYQESFRCEYVCETCGQSHSIDASHFKADVDFSILDGIQTDVFYRNIPSHLTKKSKCFSGTNELTALAKYRMMHKMDPLHVTSKTNLKKALIDLADKIYQDSGVRECNIFVFGIAYKDFMKEFFPDSVASDNSTYEFIKRMKSLEQTAADHQEGIAEIRAELDDLEIAIQRKKVEKLEARRLNNYEKSLEISAESIPEIEKQKAQKTKQLWKLLLHNYECI